MNVAQRAGRSAGFVWREKVHLLPAHVVFVCNLGHIVGPSRKSPLMWDNIKHIHQTRTTLTLGALLELRLLPYPHPNFQDSLIQAPTVSETPDMKV